MKGPIMKLLLLLLLSITSTASLAASITVNPFDLKFTMNTDAYELDFSLEMACRYEKFVISDSAQYEYIYEKVPLQITVKNIAGSEESQITVSNSQKRKLKLSGYFKSGKECQTYLHFFVNDKIYASGWANRLDRPIRLGHFEHSRLAEEKIFDFNKLNDYMGNKKISFNYRSTGRQVNIRFAFDDVSTTGMSSYLSQSAAENPETQMPYRLQK
jgi:hypothetical protein